MIEFSYRPSTIDLGLFNITVSHDCCNSVKIYQSGLVDTSDTLAQRETDWALPLWSGSPHYRASNIAALQPAVQSILPAGIVLYLARV